MIRSASPADLDALMAVDGAASPFPWSRGQFSDSLANHHLLVLESEGVAADSTVAGFLVYSRVLDEVELLNVAVAPDRQGAGHGRALVDRLIDENRPHASRIFLEVRVSNTRAIALYQGRGFCQQGVRKGYYPPLPSTSPSTSPAPSREDAWIMAYDY